MDSDAGNERNDGDCISSAHEQLEQALESDGLGQETVHTRAGSIVLCLTHEASPVIAMITDGGCIQVLSRPFVFADLS